MFKRVKLSSTFMALTEQDVYEAADQIRESGRVPSAITIREITQVGSLGTIQKHLRKWRHRETVSAASVNPPPEQVLNSIRQFGEQLWHLALQQAEKSASIKVRQAREEQDEAQRDTDEAMLQLESLQDQFSKIKISLEQEEKQHLQLKNAQQALLSEVQDLKIDLHDTRHAADRLKEQLQSSHEKYEEQTSILNQARQSLETSESQLRTKTQELLFLQKDFSVVQQDLSQQNGLNNRVVQENKDLSLKNGELTQQIERMQRELGELQLLLDKHQHEQQQHRQHQEDLRHLSIQLEAEKQVNRRLEELLNRFQPSVVPS
jgi:chromosome segregation ATPase